MRFPKKRSFRSLSEVFRDRGGATAIIVALAMPVVAGGMGLGAEVGYHFLLQRNMQHAADMAAHAGAIRLRAGDEKASVQAAARHAAIQSGFVGAEEDIDPRTPPQSGAYKGSASSVEVVLKMAQPRYFSSVFVKEPVEMSARAVANVMPSSSRACVLALAPTAARAITVSGSTSVSIENCDIVSNSNATDAFFMQNSSAKLTVGCVRTVGGAVTDGGLIMRNCSAAEQMAPMVRDPYADAVEPAIEGTCISASKKASTTFEPDFVHSSGIPALRICGGLDIKNHVSFAPGLYIIDGGEFNLNANGDVAIDAASMSGDGVTFYLAGDATLSLSGNGSLNIRAPSTGPYAGILFFGSRSQSGLTHQVLGNSGSITQGAIYVPSSAVRFTGNSTMSNGCTQIIGYTVEFTGNSTLRSNCQTNNVREIETSVMVNLVE
nr:pilus assembly protein TadG-related protein [Paracoccus saliphilus]